MLTKLLSNCLHIDSDENNVLFQSPIDEKINCIMVMVLTYRVAYHLPMINILSIGVRRYSFLISNIAIHVFYLYRPYVIL